MHLYAKFDSDLFRSPWVIEFWTWKYRKWNSLIYKWNREAWLNFWILRGFSLNFRITCGKFRINFLENSWMARKFWTNYLRKIEKKILNDSRKILETLLGKIEVIPSWWLISRRNYIKFFSNDFSEIGKKLSRNFEKTLKKYEKLFAWT